MLSLLSSSVGSLLADCYRFLGCHAHFLPTFPTTAYVTRSSPCHPERDLRDQWCMILSLSPSLCSTSALDRTAAALRGGELPWRGAMVSCFLLPLLFSWYPSWIVGLIVEDASLRLGGPLLPLQGLWGILEHLLQFMVQIALWRCVD